MSFGGSRCLACAILSALTLPVCAEQTEGVASAVDGYLSTELRYINAADESVLRLFAHLNTDFEAKGKTPFLFRFNAMGVGRLAGDPEPGDLLYSVWDTYGGAWSGRLYEVSIRFDEVLEMPWTVTVGRQFIDEGIYLHYDGARIDMRFDDVLRDLVVSIYGGAGVEWAESARDGHWLVGVMARGSIRKWRTRWRLQYLHVEESFAGINDPIVDPVNQPESLPAQTLRDDMLGITVWQPFGRTLQAFGRFTLLNGRANEIHLRVRWFTLDGEWTCLVEWYQLVNRLFNVTNDLTPYVPLLGSYDPFSRFSLRVTWRPVEQLLLEGGASTRELASGGEESAFNHEWLSYYISITRLEWWHENIDLTLTANGYNSAGSDYHVVTTNLDIRLREKLRFSTGIDYALYKYDWFSNTERENVWTWRAEVRWEPKPKVRLDVGLFVDDDRVATWTTLFAKLVWRF